MVSGRKLATTTLLCSALAVALVAAGCKNDRDDISERTDDTARTYGGTTDTTGLRSDTARLRDTSRTFSGVTPSASEQAPTRRIRRSTATRRMTDAERQLYQQGQWDTTRLQQDTTLVRPTPLTPQDTTLVQPTPLTRAQPDITRTDTTSFGNLYAPRRDTTKAGQLDSAVTKQAPLQQDTLHPAPDTAQPQPDTTPVPRPDTALVPQPDTAVVQQEPSDILAPADSTKPEGVVAGRANETSGGKPTDAQIVQLAISVNSADSSLGVLAQTRAADAQVREFARMIEQDHGAANQRIQELVRRLNILPDSTWDENRELREDSRATVRDLAERRGADFDRAYVDQEVELHEAVLEQLERELIPNADNTELKTLLQETRQSVQRHLDRARELQNTLRRR